MLPPVRLTHSKSRVVLAPGNLHVEIVCWLDNRGDAGDSEFDNRGLLCVLNACFFVQPWRTPASGPIPGVQSAESFRRQRGVRTVEPRQFELYEYPSSVDAGF